MFAAVGGGTLAVATTTRRLGRFIAVANPTAPAAVVAGLAAMDVLFPPFPRLSDQFKRSEPDRVFVRGAQTPKSSERIDTALDFSTRRGTEHNSVYSHVRGVLEVFNLGHLEYVNVFVRRQIRGGGLENPAKASAEERSFYEVRSTGVSRGRRCQAGARGGLGGCS